MKRTLLILLGLLSMPAIAWPFSLMPAPTDQSVIFLSYVFGVVNGVLHGSGSQIMGKMFAQFNSAVLALGGVVLVYTTIMGVLNTAQEGEFLGKKYSSVFVPIRTLLGILLVAPTSTGYSWIQVFVIWIVLQGVGAANAVWNAALNYLLDGGVIITQSQDIGGGFANSTVRPKMTDLTSATACLETLQSAINQVVYSNAGSVPPPKNQALASVINAIDPNSPGLGTIQMPSFAADDQPWAGLNGICGSLSNIAPGHSDDSSGTLVSSGSAGYVALRQAILDIASGVQYVVGSTCNASCYKKDPNPADPNGYVTTSCAAGTYVPSGGASCSASATCTPGGIAGSNTQPNDYAYFGSYDLTQPIVSWCNNFDFSVAPNLQDTFNVAVLDYAGLRYVNESDQSNSDAAQDLIGHAKAGGWFNAGAYYFDLVSMNSGAQNGSATSDQAFQVNPPGNVQNTDGSVCAQGSGSFSMTPDYISCYLKKSLVPASAYAPGSSNDQKTLDLYSGNFYTWLLPFFGSGDSQHHNGLLNQFVTQQNPPANYGHVAPFNFQFSDPGGGIIGMILRSLMAGPFQMLAAFIDMTNAQANGANPVVLMMQFGAGMMNTALEAWMATFGVAFAVTFSLGAAISFTFSNAMVAGMIAIVPLLSAILIPLFVTGAMLTFYLPLVPFMIFTFGVIGWIIGVIEAMIAAPIVGFGMLNPEGHDLWGKADPAVMLLLNLFLRPPLMIFGLIAGIMLSYIGVWIINNGFTSVVGVIANTIGMNFADYLVAVVALPMIYMIMVMQVINRSFTLIHVFPDKITRWLSGGHTETLGSEMAGAEKEARGAAQGGFKAMGEQGQTFADKEKRRKAGEAYDTEKGELDKKGGGSTKIK